MTEFFKAGEMKILVSFYHVEDRVGEHRLIVIDDVHMALCASWIHADLARQYRSVELVCTVPVTPVSTREFNVDMSKAAESLCRLHAKEVSNG